MSSRTPSPTICLDFSVACHLAVGLGLWDKGYLQGTTDVKEGRSLDLQGARRGAITVVLNIVL